MFLLSRFQHFVIVPYNCNTYFSCCILWCSLELNFDIFNRWHSTHLFHVIHFFCRLCLCHSFISKTDIISSISIVFLRQCLSFNTRIFFAFSNIHQFIQQQHLKTCQPSVKVNLQVGKVLVTMNKIYKFILIILLIWLNIHQEHTYSNQLLSWVSIETGRNFHRNLILPQKPSNMIEKSGLSYQYNVSWQLQNSVIPSL